MAVLNALDIKKLSNEKSLLGDDFNIDNIQGCSYDLRIGTIFYSTIKNGIEEDAEVISIARNNDKIIRILPSEIVTMLTYEVVNLPDDICATVFPINKQSSKGLLILNSGHIDPGYKGPISICAINLSRETINLSLKENIFTIVFEYLTNKTFPYKFNTYNSRIEYENYFFKNKASKLSKGIFDLITLNKYIPHLRNQIKIVLNERRANMFKWGLAIIVGTATIIGTIFASNSIWDGKVKNLNQKIEILDQQKIDLIDSLYYYKTKYLELEDYLQQN